MMKMEKNSGVFGIVLVIMVLFSGCQSQDVKKEELTSDMNMRINILYEHTIMMKDLSNSTKMIELGIDTTNLKRNDLLTSNDKLILLENAYDLHTRGSYDIRIKALEEKMNKVMQKWA